MASGSSPDKVKAMPPPDYTGFWKLLYDWQTLIAGGAAIIGGVVAYVAGRIQARATRDAADRQIAAIKSTLQAESIIKLMDKFDSDEFQEKRKRAAHDCLNHLEEKNPGVAIEDILDFFDDVAFLVTKGALDAEMMWHPFYHWLRMYYQASEQYIINRTKTESAVWNYMRSIYPRLSEIEKAESRGLYKDKLTDAELRFHLQEEIS
jgi:hypothetical protein